MTPVEGEIIAAAVAWYRACGPYGPEGVDGTPLGRLASAVEEVVAPDECQCSRTERVYCHAENCHGGADVAEWVTATFLDCLAGDHIRLGAEETDVIRSSSGIWHADTSDAWRPKAWKHTELRMDLAANPGFRQYPHNTPVDILMTPERKAVHVLNQGFPGSAVISSDVD